jgi:hypothetical protein
VADAIRMVGRRYQQLGTRDFQVGRFSGQLDFRLQRQVKAFENEDPSATRVKSVPLQLVQHVVTAAHKSTSTSDAQKAIAGMACLAFFFLLRPEEYTYTKTRHPSVYKPFTYTLDNVGSAPPDAFPTDLPAVTAVFLCFVTPKHGVKGKTRTHSSSGDGLVCPNALRQSLAAFGPGNLGIKPDELEASSLWAGGKPQLPFLHQR